MKNLFKFIAIAVFSAILFAVAGFIFTFVVKVPVISYICYAFSGASVIFAVVLVITGYVSVNKNKEK